MPRGDGIKVVEAARVERRPGDWTGYQIDLGEAPPPLPPGEIEHTSAPAEKERTE